MTLYTTMRAVERLRAAIVEEGDRLAELGDWRGAFEMWGCARGR